MKKFSNISEELKTPDEKYPFKCRYKERNPDPGLCWIIDIDFDNRDLGFSNGSYRYSASFDDVEFIPDIFILNKYNL
jgi:hypothetical protein